MATECGGVLAELMQSHEEVDVQGARFTDGSTEKTHYE